MTMDGFLYSPDWDPHVDPRKKKTPDIRSQTTLQISNKC